jgi:5-amino-6-(5-phosphoribosylamino)uracil reductase
MTLHRFEVDADSSVDPLELIPFEHRPAPPDRPWVFTNMVATLDGATAIDGVSGPLGDTDDRLVFRALRASADVILVGAATANSERYRPPVRSAEVDRVREQTGRQPRPRIAIASGSLSIDPTLELFTDPTYRPLIYTSSRAPEDRRQQLLPHADVVTMGDGHVDLDHVMRHLAGAGHRTVLSEGGPSINGQLIASDLIDEWNLTLTPLLAGGAAPRPAHGADAVPRSFRLDRCWTGRRAIFGRWVRQNSGIELEER